MNDGDYGGPKRRQFQLLPEGGEFDLRDQESRPDTFLASFPTTLSTRRSAGGDRDNPAAYGGELTQYFAAVPFFSCLHGVASPQERPLSAASEHGCFVSQV